MARLNVNPTRMELLRCKKKLDFSIQGHRMLKDKQDTLIRVFMTYYDKATSLRRQIEASVHRMQHQFTLASMEVDANLLDESLSHYARSLHVLKHQEQVLGIAVVKFECESLEDTPTVSQRLLASHPRIDAIRNDYEPMQAMLVELAELEARCVRLAKEIQGTRRRVNALKYKSIPMLEETISYIEMRLDDQARSQQARIHKIAK